VRYGGAGGVWGGVEGVWGGAGGVEGVWGGAGGVEGGAEPDSGTLLEFASGAPGVGSLLVMLEHLPGLNQVADVRVTPDNRGNA
jgi:hypothetical protein